MATRANNVTSTTAFTLIEIMVVLVILGVIAAVVIPLAVDADDFQVTGGARILVSDLEYAQNVAITTQTSVTVTFDIAGDSYTLSNASGLLIHPMTKNSYTIDFNTMQGFASVDMVSASFGGTVAVTFDEMGAPDNPGTVVIQAGDYRYQVDVAAATGRVVLAVAGS